MGLSRIAARHVSSTPVTARRGTPRWRRLVPIYLMILPGMALFLFWTLYPLVYAFVMSFFDWNPNPSAESPFVGFANYTRAFVDPVLWQALGNVLYYAAVTIVAQMVLGLAMALLLNRKFPGRSVFRALYYLPVITSWVVVSYVFAYLFSAPDGPVSWLFGNVLHLIDPDQGWMGSTTLAMPMLMILGVWKGVGFTMVIFLAGLQSIPAELYEAAAIDGASRWQRFSFITLPLLRSVSAFIAVILIIGAFGSFIQMFVLTKGGPLHATETLLTYAYSNAFATFDFGYAAALSYIFAAITLMFALVQIRLMRR